VHAINRTFVALSTPQGVSGIAVVRMSGGLCSDVFEKIFGHRPVPRRAHFGIYRNLMDEELDDVVVTYYRGPSSFTGNDMLEISCHGNPIIISHILEDLCARGFQLAEPGEFTRTAFLNGKFDLSQAEAVADVIHASSDAALKFARRQLSGALGRILLAPENTLLSLLAQVEASIDFPEDISERNVPRAKIAGVRNSLEQLLRTVRHRNCLERGVSAVLIGAPNAGKSSLLNALLGRDRALVSAIAGTTRDFIEESIALGSWRLTLIDTAGIGAANGELEALAVARSVERAMESDLLLWVIDRSDTTICAPLDFSQLAKRRGVIILNKKDLPMALDAGHPLLTDIRWPVVEISTKAPRDIDTLRSFLECHVKKINLVPDEEEILVNYRHAELLRVAIEALLLAEDISDKCEELLASELRRAIDAIAAINGAETSEAVLDRIFSQFCIGK
jgi:tRNA modification GTPase